jgi:mannose-6-phosphate isomerase class I
MKSNYDRTPSISITNQENQCWAGWQDIIGRISDNLTNANTKDQPILTIECYTGVFAQEIIDAINTFLPDSTIFKSEHTYLPEQEINRIVAPYNGGDDPVFGWLTGLKIDNYLDPKKVDHMRAEIAQARKLHPVVVIGCGASLIHHGDTLVYADLARWEAQMRMRRNEIANLGTSNHDLKWSLQYKRAYFNDWRVCDHLKRNLINRYDFVLDTNTQNEPKLVSQTAVQAAYQQALNQPFRVVPFFDPAPWGGQWMKKHCNLPDGPPNYGWCFDGVPEENSIVFQFGDTFVELPSINLVFHNPDELLGTKVRSRFGDEFPIRFDLLDTIDGGHLSFQVHPLTEYVQHHFGIHYTQDESYYILDAEEGATVYLGLKENIDPDAMLDDLKAAQRGEKTFDDKKFVCQWPAKKHDHFLIPAGTCHCSGSGTMVLEISATPYIFTLKLWDWGRLGLDGQPRPINLERGKENIVWDRTEKWVGKELVNAIEDVDSGNGWREERTGLHELEFIETRRHWFTEKVTHHTNSGVNLLNLVEGREAIIESPTGAFTPFVIHYAETVILPASLGAFTIRPHGEGIGQTCGTLKAYVRT